MVRVRGLSAGYGERVVLERVSMEAPAGCTTAVLGPGASGKSTLLRALGVASPGLDLPAGDDFWCHGVVEIDEPAPAVFVQKAMPRPEPLARLLPDAPHAVREIWAPAPEAAEALEEVAEVPIGVLSRSLRRLAELTLTVASGRSLLLMDEPEAGLTIAQVRWVEALLRSLRGRTTLLVVTHNVSLARAVAHHAVLLVDGAVIEAGDAADFFDRPRHQRTRHFVAMGS